MNITHKILGSILSPLGYYPLKKKEGFHYCPNIYGKSYKILKDFREDGFYMNIAEKVIKEKRTCLFYDKLYILQQAIENIARSKYDVAIAEVGVYRGGGSYFMADVAQRIGLNVRMYCIDTFEGHSEKDFLSSAKEGNNTIGLFGDTDYEDVKNYLGEFPFVKIIKGRIQDCSSQIEHEKFSLVHLDMDLYQPTAYALSFFGPRMASHGIIILDDYKINICPGVERAVEEFLKVNKGVIKFGLSTCQAILIF